MVASLFPRQNGREEISEEAAARGTRAPKRRRLAGVIGALMTVSILSGVMTSCETTAADRRAVVSAINHSRAQAGLPGVREHADLNAKASAWASAMRDRCQISHSTLSDGAPRGWRKLGENVGRGGSIGAVHTAYLNSPGHRRNILDGSYNYVGAGAVWGECNGRRTVFTVQVFMTA
jgi:uncharacterized protein YkwD